MPCHNKALYRHRTISSHCTIHPLWNLRYLRHTQKKLSKSMSFNTGEGRGGGTVLSPTTSTYGPVMSSANHSRKELREGNGFQPCQRYMWQVAKSHSNLNYNLPLWRVKTGNGQYPPLLIAMFRLTSPIDINVQSEAYWLLKQSSFVLMAGTFE